MRILVRLRTCVEHVEPLMQRDSIFETGIKTYVLTIESCLNHFTFRGTASGIIFALIFVTKGILNSGGQVIGPLERIIIRASAGRLLVLSLLLLFLVLPATLKDGLEYHSVRC